MPDAYNPRPPKLAQKLLMRFLRDELAEEVQGDLEEKFYSTVKEKTLFRAKLSYWYQVIHYLRPFAIRKSASYNINSYDMFQNYFRITLRNLLKQKLYSTINIGGLAVGLSCFTMILLYVQHEFSYDRFYRNADRIYHVYQRQAGNVFLGTDYFAMTPAKLAPVLMDEFPEVSFATTIAERSALLVKGEKYLMETGFWADRSIFKVFSFNFIKGNPEAALRDPYDIVVTESLAKKLFGTQDPIGQSLKFANSEHNLNVTAVIADLPENSSFTFSYVVNFLSDKWYVEQMTRTTWNNNSFHTFLLLAEGAGPESVVEKFPALLKKYQDPEDYANYPFRDEYFLENLRDIHLRSGINFDIGLKGNAHYVYLFSAIGIIVLLLACVNYMNLAVARSVNRAREVGIRKVVGAIRWQLIRQFWSESVLIAFVALVLSLVLTYLLLPFFGNLIERPLRLNFYDNKLLLPGLTLLTLAVGLFSGNYPALFMSALHPVQVLKGKMHGRFSGQKVQRWLIVGQFVVSIALVTGSVIIYSQLEFIQKKELGYDKDHVVIVSMRDLMKNYETIRNEWLQNPNIIAMTPSSHVITDISSSTIINDEKGSSREDDLAIYELRTDHDFLNVFGIELLTGRTFSSEVTGDEENSYIINEIAAKALGWSPKEAVGKQFTHHGVETVIGVVKDFHMHSMHLAIQPLMIRADKNYNRFISVKIRPNNLQETIAMMGKTANKFSPYPFEYQFMDEHFDRLYKADIKLGEVVGFFTLLSILIASLGLFGLAAFTSGTRTKEIGIRKTLGASARNIVVLISKDFLSLIVIAFFLSIPIAWYGMSLWLRDFAYRIDIEWWMFACSGLLALVTAYLAISYQSLKAAWVNPVDSLKSE